MWWKWGTRGETLIIFSYSLPHHFRSPGREHLACGSWIHVTEHHTAHNTFKRFLTDVPSNWLTAYSFGNRPKDICHFLLFLSSITYTLPIIHTEFQVQLTSFDKSCIINENMRHFSILSFIFDISIPNLVSIQTKFSSPTDQFWQIIHN